MRDMCLYYALDQLQEKGGYILFRRSTHWVFLHVLHLDNKTGEITHYIPPEDLDYPWYSLFGFEGYIKKGDLEECVPVSNWCMLLGAICLLFFGGVWVINRTLKRRNKRRGERREVRRGDNDRRRLPPSI